MQTVWIQIISDNIEYWKNANCEYPDHYYENISFNENITIQDADVEVIDLDTFNLIYENRIDQDQ